jgi:hypothetical protein
MERSAPAGCGRRLAAVTRRRRVVVEAAELMVFGLGLGLGTRGCWGRGSMAGGLRWMPGGGGRPGGGCGLRGGEDGGDGAAGRVGEDLRWVVSAAGVNDGRG